MDLDNFINKIFSEKPKERNTINLEFTDIIIIMHKIEDVKKQLIARAQRPGRTEQLEIYQLLHLNECMEKLN